MLHLMVISCRFARYLSMLFIVRPTVDMQVNCNACIATISVNLSHVVLSGDGWFLEKIIIKSGPQSTAEDLVFRCHR